MFSNSNLWIRTGCVAQLWNHIRLSAFHSLARGLETPVPTALSGSRQLVGEPMNTEKFEDEGWRTLWLAIAGVLAITLTWNVLMLSLNGISH